LRSTLQDTTLVRVFSEGPNMFAALIMAGGRSQRMRAAGCAHHKALREVLGVPLIERNLRALVWFGFERLFVAVNAREAEVAAWIEGRGRSIAPSLEVLVEIEPLGTIGAIGSLPRDVDDVLVVNVDNLTSLDLRELARFHVTHGAAATIATHVQPFPIPFGMVELAGDRVVAYREKPSVPVPISSGTYVFGRRAIDRVRGRLDVPALIDALLRAGDTVLSYAHSAPWIDVNDEATLAHAQRLVAENESRWPGEGRP
jgi:NDP-sugar pyrophosphorylase family protein